MEFHFECDCGEEISDFTRGVATEISTQVECGGCNSLHDLIFTSIGDNRPSMVIVRAVAAITNMPVDELDPLSDAVDPDAIDDILTHRDGARVTFDFYGLQIQADSKTIVILIT